MKQLTMEDIKPLSEYEAIRKTFQQEIISLKKRRRILLGRNISLVFENRETLLFQIQEMMRVEHIYDPARIRDELDTYNPLIAGPGELSATLFIEITESDRVKDILDGLQGIDNGRSVFIQLGPDRIYGLFEEGHSKEDKLSAVHYVRFSMTPAQQAALRDHTVPAAITLDHPAYQDSTVITQEIREELARDFREPDPNTRS